MSVPLAAASGHSHTGPCHCQLKCSNNSKRYAESPCSVKEEVQSKDALDVATLPDTTEMYKSGEAVNSVDVHESEDVDIDGPLNAT